MSGSVVTVTYYLYKNGTPIGSAAGTGSPIDYGLYTSAGTYTVIALSTLTGCSSLQNGSAVITTVAPPVAGTITGPTILHTGATITLTPSVTGGAWSSSNAHATVSSSGVVTGVSAGPVNISYTMSNGVCAVSAVQYLTEVGPVAPQAVGLTTGNTSICVGGTSALSNTFSGGTWTSENPQIATVGANTGIVEGISAGTALISYTISGGLSVVTPIEVKPIGDAVTIVADRSISANSSVTFDANVNNHAPVDHYQWLINNRPVEGANDSTYSTASLHDKDDIACEIVPQCGMPLTGHYLVSNASETTVPSVLNTESLSIVPNPNKGLFTIKGGVGKTGGSNTNTDVAIEITDVLGRLIFTCVAQADNGYINKTIQLDRNLANGMYVLSVRAAGFSQVFHVVVEQ
jgi:hypothetical protein